MRIRFLAAATLVIAIAQQVAAQVPSPIVPTTRGRQIATIEEQLVSRLRATTLDRRAYIRAVTNLIEDGKLDAKLVIALERYAIRRNRAFPLPFFERALRIEAKKRGVVVPPLKTFVGTKAIVPRR